MRGGLLNICDSLIHCDLQKKLPEPFGLILIPKIGNRAGVSWTNAHQRRALAARHTADFVAPLPEMVVFGDPVVMPFGIVTHAHGLSSSCPDSSANMSS